jgi:hypothetical protein
MLISLSSKNPFTAMSQTFSRVVSFGIGLPLLLIVIISVFRKCTTDDIFYEPFNEAIPSTWDINTPNVPGDWSWSFNGTANSQTFWNDRPAIQSLSGGGAAVFNSDSLAGGALVQHFSQLTSPKIRQATRHDQLYLSFYQYYRKLQGQAIVEVYGDTTGDKRADAWILVNDSVIVGFSLDSIAPNQETDPGERYVYDITSIAAGVSGVRVRFTFSGALYFWIIDDVTVGPDYSLPQSWEVPFDPDVRTLEEVLTGLGLPAQSDGSGGYYHPNELIVFWQPDADGSPLSETEREAVRQRYNVANHRNCDCEPRLELWEIEPQDPDNPNPQPTGDTIGIQGIKDGASTESRTMDLVGYNYYNASRGNLQAGTPNPPLDPTTIATGLPTDNGDAVVIAILDTGVDYTGVDMVAHIHRSEDSTNCGGIQDVIGWDMISNHGNPMDNHPYAHGTNVARVTLQAMIGSGVDFRILPVKTHDHYGLANLFHVTCGTYYAISENADVINMSWGWYSETDSILLTAIDSARARNITVTTVAGNDGRTLSQDTMIYPAGYDLENILTVGAFNRALNPVSGIPEISEFSNRSDQVVDLAVQGEDVYVLGTKMPSEDARFLEMQEENRYLTGAATNINGTSFAAPYVAALAARARGNGVAQPWVKVRDCASSILPELRMPENEVRDGAYIKANQNCGF